MDQPPPTPNKNPSVWLNVIQDMFGRNAIGIERYGTPLQPFNGRNSIQDIYEELLDACVYMKQKMIEDAAIRKFLLRIENSDSEFASEAATLLGLDSENIEE